MPLFKAKTGIVVRVIAQGTGQALDTARRGDVVFVHAKPQEEKFVADGFGMRRFDVMYNDFVLMGPNTDPADVAGTKDITAALAAIKAKQRRSSRAATAPVRIRPSLHCGRPAASTSPRTGRVVPGDRPGYGRRAEHRGGDESLCTHRPRHLDFVQEPR